MRHKSLFSTMFVGQSVGRSVCHKLLGSLIEPMQSKDIKIYEYGLKAYFLPCLSICVSQSVYQSVCLSVSLSVGLPVKIFFLSLIEQHHEKERC